MRAPPSLRTTVAASLIGFGVFLVVLNYILLWRSDAQGYEGVDTPEEFRQMAYERALHYSFIEVAVVAAGTFALWLGWDRCITRRAVQITEAAGRISPETEPQAPLPGRDELSRISQALHQAHLRLREQAAALRRRDERYRHMVEVMPSIVLVNRDDRFEYVNPAGVELMRAGSAEKILGMSVWELVHPKDQEAVRERIRLMRDEGRSVPVQEQTFVRVDGEPLHVEVASSTFVDERGPAIQVVAYDITARKAAEERREALTRQLAEKNKELETLLYVASHDLRSPLVNIQGFSRTLEREWREAPAAFEASQCPAAHAWLEQSAPRVQRALDYITSSVGRIDALLEGLLRVSRLGRSALEVRVIEPDALVGEVLRSLRFQIEQKNATVITEPLPPCLADAHMLSHIFSNLLDNALKYADSARPCRITIRGTRTGDRVRYEVQDNGVGIPPEQQERVFEIFQRGPDPSAPGEGLGLTLAQRCAERIGGKISLRSEAGTGSSFTVDLPAA